MKSLKVFSITNVFVALALLCTPLLSIAQKATTETIKVSGECGMCKKNIEKAAKGAGASYALWNKETKVLTVKYSSSTTNSAKIQQKIANAGYDTPQFKATDEAYNKLDECCQYERTSMKDSMSCCSAKCEMKDGKCVDMAACKDKGCCQKTEGKTAMNCDSKSCCKKTE
jgi:mercuric ion binding protein